MALAAGPRSCLYLYEDETKIKMRIMTVQTN